MCRILFFSAFIYISDAKLQWEDSPKHVELIEVDFGSSVSIECNLHIGEKVHSSSHIKVVTWHKNSYKKPIYRVHYDQHLEPIHWSARPNHYLAITPNDSSPYLVIEKTRVRDTGGYRCHIRYQGREQSNKYTNVKIIYPPGKPQIWHTNTGISIDKNTVPFKVGENLNLSCKSVGGYPTSTVRWLKDYVKLNSSFQRFTSPAEISINIPNLTSSDNGILLSCRASQFKMSKFVTTTVKLIAQEMKELERVIEEMPSNSSVISVSVLKSKIKHMKGTELERMSDDGCNATTIKSNNTFNNHHSSDEEVKYHTTYVNLFFIFVMLGICVFICIRLI